MVKEKANPVDADQIEADPERPGHRKSEVGREGGRHRAFGRDRRGQQIAVGGDVSSGGEEPRARQMTPCAKRPGPRCDDDESRRCGPFPVTNRRSTSPPSPPTATTSPAPSTATDDNYHLSLLFCAACRMRQERSLTGSASGRKCFSHVTSVSASYRHAITGYKQASASWPAGDAKSPDYRSHGMDDVGDVCHVVQDELPLLRLVQGQLLSRDIIRALYAEYYNDIKVPPELYERLDSRPIDPGTACSHHGNGQVTSVGGASRDSAMNGACAGTRICESFKAGPGSLSDSGYSSLERAALGVGDGERSEDVADGEIGQETGTKEYGGDDVTVTMDVNTYTREKLNQRSKDMLTVLKDQFSTLIQVVSEELVRLLEERHELKEQVEMRKIAVEQLVRLQGNALRKESPTETTDRIPPSDGKHRTQNPDTVRSTQSLDKIHDAVSLEKAHMTQSLYTLHSTQSLDNVHCTKSPHTKHNTQSWHSTCCSQLHLKISDTQPFGTSQRYTIDNTQSHDKRHNAVPTEATHGTQCSVMIHTTQTVNTVQSTIHSTIHSTVHSTIHSTVHSTIHNTQEICGDRRHHVLIGSEND